MEILLCPNCPVAASDLDKHVKQNLDIHGSLGCPICEVPTRGKASLIEHLQSFAHVQKTKRLIAMQDLNIVIFLSEVELDMLPITLTSIPKEEQISHDGNCLGTNYEGSSGQETKEELEFDCVYETGKGFCLVIDNDFEGDQELKPRQGSNLDSIRIKSVMELFGFKVKLFIIIHYEKFQ